jgi:putative transposase
LAFIRAFDGNCASSAPCAPRHPTGHRGLYKLIADKAERAYEIPGSLRRHVAAETIRGWLSDYRRAGFDALLPKVRSDLGAARTIPMRVLDVLCELKEAQPDLTIPLVIKQARASHPDVVPADLALPLSTVHRLLSRRGLTGPRPEEGTTKDRRRFE